MAKKKRGRKMPKWKKWIKMILGIAGAGVGGAVALSPTYRGLTLMTQGHFDAGTNALVFDVAGVDTQNPGFPDVNRLVGTGLTVLVGVGIISLFRYVARRV